jgi:hypothetical protein
MGISCIKGAHMKKLGALLACCGWLQAQQAPVPLNSLVTFSVLGASTVTSTGFTIVNGNLGLSPLSAVTGFPPGVVSPPYSIHINDSTAITAQSDLTTAYNNAATPSRAGSAPITATGDLGGQVLAPGLYVASGTSMSVGAGETLTLNGPANGVWVFQIGTTLTVLGNVVLTGGAQAANVFWQVGSSATLGVGAHTVGTIMAQASVSLNTGAVLVGRALARTGAVTMQSNPITQPGASVTSLTPPALTAFCPANTAYIGVPYNSSVVATGGTTPYTNFSVSVGTLPPGLGPINASTGDIAGTPTTAGPDSFSLRVTDSAANTVTQVCSIASSGAPPPTTPVPSSLSLVLIGFLCASLYLSRESLMRLVRRN